MKHPMPLLVVLAALLLPAVAPAQPQISLGVRLPGLSIGLNLPAQPELSLVPGYPVYYAPRLNSNYFFYDGMYWVYQNDDWYTSDWYNGPWGRIAPDAVPEYLLRVPVRYYRQPPGYFRGWRAEAPPHWGEHWGNDWQQRRSGWDQWNRRAAPAPAPLPRYQRSYSGERYPQAEQQRELRDRNYRYEPRDSAVQPHYRAPEPARGDRGNDHGNERGAERGKPDRGERPGERGDEREPGGRNKR